MAQVHTPAIVASIALETAAAAYTSGKLIGSIQEIPNFAQNDKGAATLESLTLIDTDKQKAAVDLLFFDSAPSAQVDQASENTSDADMKAKCLGILRLAAADYIDMANSSILTARGLALKLRAAAKSKSIWVMVVSRGTPTYTTTNSLTLKLGLNQN